MRRRAELRVASTLRAEPEAVAAWALSAEGINAELGLARIDPRHGFTERSRMLSQRRWEHERTIVAGGEGAVVVDRVAWEPRPPLPGRLLRPLFAATFAHRHRRLRRRFGGAPLPAAGPTI